MIGNRRAVLLMTISALTIAIYPSVLKIFNGAAWFLAFAGVVSLARASGIFTWCKISSPEMSKTENHKRFLCLAFKGIHDRQKFLDKHMWLVGTSARIATSIWILATRWIDPAAAFLIYEAATLMSFFCFRIKDSDRRSNKQMASAKMSWLIAASVIAGAWMVKNSENGEIALAAHPAWLLVAFAGFANAIQIERSLKFGEYAAQRSDMSCGEKLKTQTYWSSAFSAYAAAAQACVLLIAAAAAGHYSGHLAESAAVFALMLGAGSISMICSRAANVHSDRLDIEVVKRLSPVFAVGFMWLAAQAGWTEMGIENWVWFWIGCVLVVICSLWSQRSMLET